MTPQLTMLASAFGIALVGTAFLPQQVGPDNVPLSSLSTGDRTTGEIYATYFPSPEVDPTTDDASPRLQRNLVAQPVFLTVADPQSPLQQKLADARKSNQRQRARQGVTDSARSAKTSSASPASTNVTRRRGPRQTIVELARTRMGQFSRHQFKNLARSRRKELRREQLRRSQKRRPQLRVNRQTNVRQRTRLNASQPRSKNN